MASIESISPERANELLDAGHVYLDVRSEAEFLAGHPPGAYSIPLLEPRGSETLERPDFLALVGATFAPEVALVIGCAVGVRSLRAAQLLLTAGYGQVANMRGGWEGGRDPFGRRLRGWSELGLPVEFEPLPGRSFAELRRHARAARGE